MDDATSPEGHGNSGNPAGSSTKEKVRETLDQIIPFSSFVDFLEKLSNSDGEARRRRLKAQFNYFRIKFKEFHGTMDSEEAHGDSIFTIVRILLPKLDRARGSYGMQGSVLGRILAKVLGLSKASPDGVKLINWKEPKKAGGSAGDMGTIVFGILEKRFADVPKNGPTIADLHHLLDQLAMKSGGGDKVSQEIQVKLLQGFLRRLTPLEGKWLTRILLKALGLDIHTKAVLTLIHPQANDLLDTLGLEQVCKRLNDPDAQVGSSGNISLFTFFKPMLCLRYNILSNVVEEEEGQGQDQVDSSTTTKGKRSHGHRIDMKQVSLPTPPYIIETKWDGERFQIHYEFDSASGKENFKYFSRMGFDFSGAFNETLTPRLRDCLIRDPPLTTFILDGEMMAWHKERKTFTQKGANIDVKRMNLENKNHCPTFVAFDVLHYNGKSVAELPLKSRSELLRKILLPRESVCGISEQKLAYSRDQVIEAINDAIDNLDEGIVLKDLNSTYEPGERIPTWLKIKPDYVEGSRLADMDFLILGANYGHTARTGGSISSFWIGLKDDKMNFYPVTRVSRGRLGDYGMKTLISELQPHFQKIEVPSVKYKGRRRPELFIRLEKSIVLQIRASEIIYSKDYELNYTFRFPIAVAVRRDKPWTDVMSLQEFHDLRLSCDGKLAKRTDSPSKPQSQQGWKSRVAAYPQRSTKNSIAQSHSDEETPLPSSSRILRSRARAQTKPITKTLITTLKPAPTSMLSNIFKTKIFCVVGNMSWKENMETKLKSHGAELVQNPTSDTMCVIAEKESVRVKNIIQDGSFDVVKSLWIDQCIQTGTLVTFQPEHLFYAKEETKQKFQMDFDEFGDPFRKKLSLSEVKLLVGNVIKQLPPQDQQELSPEAKRAIKREVDQEIFSPGSAKASKWSFMSGCKIAFRDPSNDVLTKILESQVLFYGGTVAEDECSSGVTHVVMGPTYSPGKKTHLSAFVVKRNWLEDCLRKRRLINEFLYTISE